MLRANPLYIIRDIVYHNVSMHQRRLPYTAITNDMVTRNIHDETPPLVLRKRKPNTR